MPNLPPAKFPLPKSPHNEQLARYFDTHSVAAIWDKLQPAPPLKLPASQVRAIRARHARRKAPISIRLEPAQIQNAKRMAKRKSIGYQTHSDAPDAHTPSTATSPLTSSPSAKE